MPSIDAVAAVCIAYLIGSLPTAYIVGKYIGDADLTEVGSKNIGASNAYSQLGSRWAGFVVIVDVLIKGSLPVFIVSDAVLGLGLITQVAVGIASVIGHDWSIFLRFRGGRGIATTEGAIFVLSFPLAFAYPAIPALAVLVSPWKDSAAWWLIATLVVPVWVLLLDLPIEILWFSIALIVVTLLKRMTSNSLRGVDGSISGKLLLNRLVFDRDIKSRSEWVGQ
jgi:glycerol-3-phosphate acyltransferase PlsY|tara:strand:+ start:3390 stop:4058 length:669 start_codon:yes stop_codon:yes gene_type:complete